MKLLYLSCYHQMKLHKTILLESINLNSCCGWFTISLPFIKTSVTFLAAKVGTAYYCKMRWVENFMHSCAPTHPFPCQFCPVHSASSRLKIFRVQFLTLLTAHSNCGKALFWLNDHKSVAST